MINKYMLDYEKLQKGDIILTSGSNLQSKFIRLATISRYSHAAIWVGGTIIEATRKGVFSKNPQRLMVDEAKHLAVYRSKIPLSKEVERKVCEYAQSRVGSLYSIPEAALMLPLRTINVEKSNMEFCSRLVACSYKYAGYDLLNLRNPYFCSPRQLSLCKAFHKIEGLVKKATDDEIAFSNTPDPVLKHQSDTYEWLNNIRAFVKARPELSKNFDIQAQNDVDTLLLRHPELDEAITKVIKKTEYLNFYNYDRSINPYRYDNILMLKRLIHVPHHAEDFLIDELSREPELFVRYEKNTLHAIDRVKKIKLQYFIEQLTLYRNLISESVDKMSVIAFAFQSIGCIHQCERVKKMISHADKYIFMADKHLIK